ncbi:MAG TPA: hypothetical protein VI197_16145 [Polyangiaceae bacterium]
MPLTSQFRQPLIGLVRLYASELARLRGVRRARWLAWAVAVVSLSSMLTRLDRSAGLVIISVEALGWLTWLVGGAITWSALRNWKTLQEPLADMARERGVHAAWRDLAAPLALIRQLGMSIGVPALLLTVLAIALDSGAKFSWMYAALLVLVPSYVGLVALGIGLIVFLSAKLFPQAATSVFLVILLIPHACRELWPHTPSVIGLYSWLWDELVHLGAMA